MEQQLAVTIIARIRSAAIGQLDELLTTMGNGVANGAVIPFTQLSQLHFARILILEESAGAGGESTPPYLVFLSDIDGSLDRYLRDLVASARTGLDDIFSHCEGYPAASALTDDSRIAFLRARTVKAQTTYANRPGRTVQQVHQDAALREAIQDFLDRPGQNWSSRRPAEIRGAIQEFVNQEPTLAWARTPPPASGLRDLIRGRLRLVAVPLLLLLLSPVIILGLPFWLLLLRKRERRDPARHIRPDPARVASLASLEDRAVQNPFAGVGFLKSGRFRLLSARGVLWLVNYGTRNIYTKGQLSGVRTIHFARWVLIDDQRRLIFASNYDGSLESYMDEFIDKVAWGLNAVFSNGVGYPKTDWLILHGAKDETAFKDYLRVHQIPTRVWYSAYPRLTAVNIARNADIRRGLYGAMDATAVEQWLRLL
ncbi:MAG TPA: hypothetical protein VH482_20815 [Thermomicrobiales bacterium]